MLAKEAMKSIPYLAPVYILSLLINVLKWQFQIVLAAVIVTSLVQVFI